MTTPTHHFMSINFQLSSSFVFFLIIISSSFLNCNALGGRKILQSKYLTFDVNSFLSTSCKPQIQGGSSRPASLKVTHRYGHCSKSSIIDNKVPSLAEVLARDQIRVASIHNRHAAVKNPVVGDSKTAVVAKSGTTFGNGNYVVTVGLGTPAKYVNLVFDTGSSLTWTQCQPCAGHCYIQKDSIFDPSASTSYSNASCDSAQCSQLASSSFYAQSCSAQSSCIYSARYGDGSTTQGYLGDERLTLTANDVFDKFSFGCGENNGGLFGETAGILGLGRDYFSLISQTAPKYGMYFSYCLPTKSGSNGHLTFGNGIGAPANLEYTPLSNDPNGEFYFLNLVAIFVGGTQLPINPSVFQSGGTIIDSGTVITRLHPTAYIALRDTFKREMSQYPLAPPPFSLFDTCFDFSKQTTVTFPIVSFIFAGNVKVDLGFEEVFLIQGQSIFCFAFAANKADTDTAIFGNLQQQTLEVAYDVAGGRLGFASGGCS